MTDDIERPPWWLSGNDDSGSGSAGESSQGPNSSWDVASMLGMVTSMAGQWWAASGASDHPDHGDPSEHPDCVMCKGLLMLGSATTAPAAELPTVRWLPIRRA